MSFEDIAAKGSVVTCHFRPNGLTNYSIGMKPVGQADDRSKKWLERRIPPQYYSNGRSDYLMHGRG